MSNKISFIKNFFWEKFPQKISDTMQRLPTLAIVIGAIFLIPGLLFLVWAQFWEETSRQTLTIFLAPGVIFGFILFSEGFLAKEKSGKLAEKNRFYKKTLKIISFCLRVVETGLALLVLSLFLLLIILSLVGKYLSYLTYSSVGGIPLFIIFFMCLFVALAFSIPITIFLIIGLFLLLLAVILKIVLFLKQKV